MRPLAIGIAVTLHAAALAATAWIYVDVTQERTVAWGDGLVRLGIAERRAPCDVEFAPPPPMPRDVIPASVPEWIELPAESGAAAAGDEDDLTLPEGGEPPPAPSIAVDGGSAAYRRPNFSTFARPGEFHGGRIGRGRRGATGAGDGYALQAIARVATPEPIEPEAPSPPPRAPERVGAQILEHSQPRYPESARTHGVQGVVRLEADVLEDATVGDIRVVESSGSDLLDEAAIAGVRRWKFAPATVDGVAVRSIVALPSIRFRLK